MKTHIHHIVPKHAGGTDIPSNLVELSIFEHAEAHRKLFEKEGRLQDKLAWKMLEGKSEEAEEIRILLAKKGFQKFLNSSNSINWKNNISKSLKGKKQSKETRQKRSKSLKLAYDEGRRKSSFSDMPKEFFIEQEKKNRSKMTEARKKSEKWKTSLQSESTRSKKVLSDPRSKRVCINGIIYNSIRDASRKTGISYNKIRSDLIMNSSEKINFVTMPSSI